MTRPCRPPVRATLLLLLLLLSVTTAVAPDAWESEAACGPRGWLEGLLGGAATSCGTGQRRSLQSEVPSPTSLGDASSVSPPAELPPPVPTTSGPAGVEGPSATGRRLLQAAPVAASPASGDPTSVVAGSAYNLAAGTPRYYAAQKYWPAPVPSACSQIYLSRILTFDCWNPLYAMRI